MEKPNQQNDCVKYRGMEDKVEELDHSMKTYDWNTQKLYETLKNKSVMGTGKGRVSGQRHR